MLRWSTRRPRVEADISEELREHVARLTDENLAAGMTPAEARRAALLRFGSADALRETIRDQRRGAWVEGLVQDVRYAARMLRKSPGFTVVAVLTLALGIGANTAMFSVVDGVLLRSLNYPDSGRLVQIRERDPDGGKTAVSYVNFLDWKAQQTVFESLGVWRRADHTITGRGEPRRVEGLQMTAGVFAALGVTPALGRVFGPEDDRPGASPVVVIAHALWQQLFGGNPDVVGRPVTVNGRPYTVIGVMPAGFRFRGDPVLWEPFGPLADPGLPRMHRAGHVALGRLRPGVTLEQARTAMTAIAARLAEQYPQTNHGVSLEPLLNSLVGRVSRPLWILLGAAGLVLVIACANVAGLALARGLSREREMAVRAALGAGRRRLLVQGLTESLLLASAGALVGIGLAHLSRDLVLAVAQDRIPRATEITLDGRVLAFSTSITLFTVALCGLAPAWRSSRVDAQAALKAGRGTIGGRLRLRQGMVVAQVALTLVLMTGAGLLLRSFHRLQQVDTGFAEERLVSFRLHLPENRYPRRAQQVALYERLIDRLRAVPGIEAATLSSQVPFDDRSASACLFVEGRPTTFEGCYTPEIHLVDTEYFRTMGIPILRGRGFVREDGDRTGSGIQVKNWWSEWGGLRTVVVDARYAQLQWPNQDPIGRRLRFPWPLDRPDQQPVLTVVGVVGGVTLDRPGERNTQAQVYFPHVQGPRWDVMTVILRTAQGPQTAIAAARREVRANDRELPVFDVRTLAEMRDRSLAPERLSLGLLGTFAGIGLLLAVIGLFGVLAYVVAQNQREIGVRVALGARRGQVLGRVVGQGLLLTAAGIGIGLAGALVLTRIMESQLYEVTPTDPLTLGTVAALLIVVATLASYLPARRAAHIDPMVALRHE